jgi:acetyl-CoA acetyltransferase
MSTIGVSQNTLASMTDTGSQSATAVRLREARYGVLGVCVGSGQGVALVLENSKDA